MIYYPLYYHQLMERMNLLHCGLNGYVRQMVDAAREAYPLVKATEIEIDSRDTRAGVDVRRMEKELERAGGRTTMYIQ